MDRENRVSRRSRWRVSTLLVRSVVLAASTWSSSSMLSVTMAEDICATASDLRVGSAAIRRAHALTTSASGMPTMERAVWRGDSAGYVQLASSESPMVAPAAAARVPVRPVVIDLSIPWARIAALELAASSEAREQLPAEVVASAAPALQAAVEKVAANDEAAAQDVAEAADETSTDGESRAVPAPEFAVADNAAPNPSAEVVPVEQVAEEEFLAVRGALQPNESMPTGEQDGVGADEVTGELPLKMPSVAPPAQGDEATREVGDAPAGEATKRPAPSRQAVRRFPATTTEVVAAPEPGPESDLEPVAEHEVRWSPLPESVVERVRQHNRRAIEMAGHGAVYSSRAEFVKALRLVAHSLDSQGNSYRHTVALKNAMVALDESADFQPEGSQLPSDLDLSKIVMNHQTTLLRDRVLDDMAPAAAVRAYHRYAESQFAIACGQELVAADAMYGMARLQPLINAHDPSWSGRQAHVAMAYYQSALQVYPKHYLAAQELGLLLARDGQYSEAREVLQQAVETQPKLTQAWQYLAEVHRQLGDDQQADVAEREYLARAEDRGMKRRASGRDVPATPVKDNESEVVGSGTELADAPLPSTDSPLAWDDPQPNRVPSEANEPTMVRRRASEEAGPQDTTEPTAEVADQRAAETEKKKSFWSRWSLGKKKTSEEESK